jgi:hypothetical protein
LTATGLREAVAGDGRAVLRNETKGCDIPVQTTLSDRQKQIVLAGGILAQAAGCKR